MTDLERFKHLVGKLHAIIDGDIPATDPSANNESLMELIQNTVTLGDSLLQDIKNIPCEEQRIVILSREFVVGLAEHILNEIERR